MKRTLLEITCGLTVVVLLASLHQQIAKLKIQKEEVVQLRAMVKKAVREEGAAERLESLHRNLANRMTDRLDALEKQVTNASMQVGKTVALRKQIQDARSQAREIQDCFREHLASTEKLVHAYKAEAQANAQSARRDLNQTRTELQRFKGVVTPDARILSANMLSPAVQLNGDDTVGSGTLVYSAKNPKTGKVENYVLTAYHVVRNILSDTPTARREGIEVTLYQGDSKETVRADLIAHKVDIDTAALKLRSNRVFKYVARVTTAVEANAVPVWTPVCAVGCPLGNDPVPSHGEISSVRNELNGANYWMINAPTYFGNSGGGIYLARSHALIGVFSKIYTHGRGNPVVIPHMGLLTPVPAIRKWLRKEKKEFILDMPRLDTDENSLLNTIVAPTPR